MSGFAGCNQVNGNLHFSYNRIKISELVSTRMYCGDASDIENQILGLLRSEPFYRIDGLYLTLETTKGIIKLKKVD
ncbi:hypothetical protein CW751_12240 [Brumimicrobium salinarum]|uniref:DUF306 domain-containing protein n=1 Tax=Brumimicrobium salinarum TaxID=2058658 RepID=A0A2I0R080_9FLAO|nr:META domain-containing protein [Brumimicrobium salinarum]PKR79988.1 hypothetical protein CW751_12240 [Brumimicrobium salinarum]